MGRYKKFIGLPRLEKILVLEATLLLFMAKLLLFVLPIRHCVKLLASKGLDNTDPEMAQLLRIKKAIHQTRWLMHWKNKCIVMCVASRWMLQRRQIPSTLSLGVVFDENKKLRAHAWIKVGEFQLVEKGEGFSEIFHF